MPRGGPDKKPRPHHDHGGRDQGYYDFDERYRQLQAMGEEIERLRQQVPLPPEVASRIQVLTAEVEEGWHDLAQEILKREG